MQFRALRGYCIIWSPDDDAKEEDKAARMSEQSVWRMCESARAADVAALSPARPRNNFVHFGSRLISSMQGGNITRAAGLALLCTRVGRHDERGRRILMVLGEVNESAWRTSGSVNKGAAFREGRVRYKAVASERLLRRTEDTGVH